MCKWMPTGRGAMGREAEGRRREAGGGSFHGEDPKPRFDQFAGHLIFQIFEDVIPFWWILGSGCEKPSARPGPVSRSTLLPLTHITDDSSDRPNPLSIIIIMPLYYIHTHTHTHTHAHTYIYIYYICILLYYCRYQYYYQYMEKYSNINGNERNIV